MPSFMLLMPSALGIWLCTYAERKCQGLCVHVGGGCGERYNLQLVKSHMKHVEYI